NRAVVVEGYTDVMACHLAGVTTAVATSGTSFGEGHIKILRRLLMDNSQSEVIFTFDGDAAGQKAALRAFEDDQKFAARTSIAITPEGMDPCELRLAEGDEAVAKVVESRSPLFEFAIRSIVDQHNLDTAEGRSAALEQAAPVVAQIKDPSIQHEYAVRLAGLLGILDTQFVVRRLGQLARRRHAAPAARGRASAGAPAPAESASRQPTGTAPGGPALNLRSPAHRVERELLKLALQCPGLVSPAFDAYGADEFTAPPYATVRQTIETAGGVSGADGEFVSRVRAAASDDTVRSLVMELVVEPLRSARGREPDEMYAGMQLVAVRLAAVNSRIADLESNARRLEAQRDEERSASVRQEIWTLQQYGRALRERGASAL
ncbi:MAG TPA: toprim domain-containing protein, partial [Streptomyces sp.]|nr:toprim domain-containing protein [Streptomyces sp.]